MHVISMCIKGRGGRQIYVIICDVETVIFFSASDVVLLHCQRKDFPAWIVEVYTEWFQWVPDVFISFSGRSQFGTRGICRHHSVGFRNYDETPFH